MPFLSNEVLLIINLIIIYSTVLIFYKLFGRSGLLCWTVFATIAANIEVLILVEAFGLEQTLGNILFASTFLVTDILSEIYGKKKANEAVNIGIIVSGMFIIVSQIWLLYTPSPNDRIFSNMQAVFSNTPRVMISGLLVFAIVQRFDVWLYHKIWNFTENIASNKNKFLWLRNNGSTLVSQLLNSILFTVAAFYGVFEYQTLLSIISTTYIIFIVTSLLDTPVVYLARKMSPNIKE
jgi:uncharacterized integral membrane protein (TIGR00697 family)